MSSIRSIFDFANRSRIGVKARLYCWLIRWQGDPAIHPMASFGQQWARGQDPVIDWEACRYVEIGGGE